MAVQLDLRRDFADIYAYLADRVRRFDPHADDGLGDSGLVKMIVAGFEYPQAGWVLIAFDTRPDAELDGEWDRQIDGNELERTHWMEAGEAEEPITLVGLDGMKTILPPDTELAEVFGEVLKAVLWKARADGLFAGLPKATGCEMVVSHFSGGYDWPAEIEAMGKENLV